MLHQQRLPVFTSMSLITTVAVEAVLVWIAVVTPGAGTNAIGAFVLGGFLVIVGSLINSIAGSIAHKRREFWGGRIAALGALAWFVTIAFCLFTGSCTRIFELQTPAQ